MKKILLPFLFTAPLLLALGISGCAKEAETTQQEAADRTRQIADSIAKADSIAILQDSLDRLQRLEEQ